MSTAQAMRVGGRRGFPGIHHLFGLGSIYAKSMRDSRLAILIVAGVLGAFMIVSGEGVAAAYATHQSRVELEQLVANLPPVMSGLYGNPVNVGSLGGVINWKIGPYSAIMASIWSILALSATLAGEASRGSLDIVAASPFGKRRIALEKLGAHLTGMVLAMAALAFSVWLTGAAFAVFPEDRITAVAAIEYAGWVGLLSLAAGAIAFALAPALGRAVAAGIAGAIMFAGYVLNGYSTVVPAFATLANLSWFHWTRSHSPLAGASDPITLLPVAILVLVLLVIGVESFVRRDIGLTSTVRGPSLPKATLGIRGPTGRAFGEALPLVLGWGTGVGLFAFVMAAASRSLAEEFAKLPPDTVAIFRSLFPNYDILQPGGYLQLVFFAFGTVLLGFAAATFVGRWAADEESGRVEMLLAAPVSRARWTLQSGIGALLGCAALAVILAIFVGAGAAIAGGDVITPVAGTVVLGLFAGACVGIGFAVAGLIGPSIAAQTVGGLVILTFLADLVIPALKLPDWVHQLALTAHLGQPMVGVWDPVGVAICLGLAFGGILLGAWGMSRRDLAD